VESFAANSLGIYDLGGNAGEWCEDEYKASMNAPYALKEIPGLEQEKAGDGTAYRVVRGRLGLKAFRSSCNPRIANSITLRIVVTAAASVVSWWYLVDSEMGQGFKWGRG
jgi:hypothetical protein